MHVACFGEYDLNALEYRVNTENLVSVAVKFSSTSEAGVLKSVEEVVKKHFKLYEILILKHGSVGMNFVDNESEISSVSNCRCIMYNRELQDNEQISALIEHSIGDNIILFDPSTDDVEMIPKLFEKAASGVSLVAVNYTHDNQVSAYALAASFFYWLLWLLTRVKIPTNSSNFVCISRELANAVVESDVPLLHLRFFAMQFGFSTEVIQGGTRPPRLSLGLLFRRMSNAVDVVSSVSLRIVKFSAVLSLFTCLANLAYLLYVACVAVFFTDVQDGWITTSFLLSVMFFVLFFILFAIGITCASFLNRSSRSSKNNLTHEFSSSQTILELNQLNVEEE